MDSCHTLIPLHYFDERQVESPVRLRRLRRRAHELQERVCPRELHANRVRRRWVFLLPVALALQKHRVHRGDRLEEREVEARPLCFGELRASQWRVGGRERERGVNAVSWWTDRRPLCEEKSAPLTFSALPSDSASSSTFDRAFSSFPRSFSNPSRSTSFPVFCRFPIAPGRSLGPPTDPVPASSRGAPGQKEVSVSKCSRICSRQRAVPTLQLGGNDAFVCVRAQVDFPCWGGRGSRPAVRRPPSKISRNFRGRTQGENRKPSKRHPSRTETPRTKLEVRRTRGRGGGRGPGRSASRAPTICHRAFDSSKTVGARTPCSRKVHANILGRGLPHLAMPPTASRILGELTRS